jgi:hypothetical protein
MRSAWFLPSHPSSLSAVVSISPLLSQCEGVSVPVVQNKHATEERGGGAQRGDLPFCTLGPCHGMSTKVAGGPWWLTTPRLSTLSKTMRSAPQHRFSKYARIRGHMVEMTATSFRDTREQRKSRDRPLKAAYPIWDSPQALRREKSMPLFRLELATPSRPPFVSRLALGTGIERRSERCMCSERPQVADVCTSICI